MEFRFFQILVPFLALLMLLRQLRAYQKNRLSLFETIVIAFFWISVSLVAVFPDFISESIAKIFGIKSNVNAIIFFTLGLLFYFQFQLYKIIKKQDHLLTELTRKIALDNVEEKEQQ